MNTGKHSTKLPQKNPAASMINNLENADQTDVIAALDLLLETLGEEKQRLNQEGAKAMTEADYDTAHEVIGFAKLLMEFHDEVENLTDKWKDLEQLRDSSSPKAKEIVSRRIFSSVTKSRDRIPSGSSTGSQRTMAKQVVAQRTTKCVQRCYHLIDYLVANGGYALAQDASKHVNRILPMKYPELKEAKAMMLEKGWISKTLSNRELQVTAAGRVWHLKKKKYQTSISNTNPSTPKKTQSAATAIAKGAKMNDEEIESASSDELPDKSETIMRVLIDKESEIQLENLNPDKEAIPDIPDSLTFAPVVFAIRSERLSIDRKEGCSNPPPKGKTNVPDFFRIKDGFVVKTGDWIEDKTYGYGKILQVNAGPYFTDRSDQHKVWFWDGTREVVMANYQLRRPTVRVAPISEIPQEILKLVPASKEPHSLMINSMKNQLQLTGANLVRFLGSQLPEIGGKDWWQNHVLQQLTYAQQGQVRNRAISHLGGLDLAALLRVFERNWAELSHAASLPNEVRTHMRELADLRNAVSHHASDGTEMPPDDVFRHLDTIARVLKAIGCDTTALETVDAAKRDAMKAMAGELIPPPQIVEIPVTVEVIRDVIREVPPTPIDTQNPAIPGLETTASIQVGAFHLIGPGELSPSRITSFNGDEVDATAIPWRVVGPDGLDFLIHVVLINEGTDAEFGQIICESRLGSPEKWDDIVRRLRMGIRRLEDGELIMDFRCAVRPHGGRATRNVKTLSELDLLTGLNVSSTLKSIGATAVGTREEIASETNRNRNTPAVSFAVDDLVTPAAAWVLATLQCLI